MIENLVIVSSAEQARNKYQLKTGKHCEPIKSPSLVSGTVLAWIVTSKDPGTLQTMRFGFTSYRSDTLTDQLNQRTDVGNKGEDDQYSIIGVLCDSELMKIDLYLYSFRR